jgi:hypothetical protein
MQFQFRAHRDLQLAIQIFREFSYQPLAVQCAVLP